MKTKRYEWSDALVEAQTMGFIGNGALLTAMKLAHAITWEPKDGRPSGLYWKNELAAATVGVSRATLYRQLPELKEAGFLKEVNGNLIATLPESQNETRKVFEGRAEIIRKSHLETPESQSETSKSQSETQKSQSDNPYTVDTYPVDVSTVDTYPVQEKAGADAPPLPQTLEDQRDVDHPPLSSDIDDPSLVTTSQPAFGFNTEEVPESQSETLSVNALVRDW